MQTCDVKTGICSSTPSEATPCEEKCSCGGVCGGDPVACATAMWTCAFHTAMKEVMVDIMKAKIQKSWGPKMDKGADIVLATMDVKWQAMTSVAKAKMELKEKLREEMMKK